MQKIKVLIPSLEASEVEVEPLALLAKVDFRDFDIAQRDETNYVYEHKIRLSNGGAVLQVLSKGADGRITEPRPEDTYDLTSQPLRLEIIDVHGDGFLFKLRIQPINLSTSASKIVVVEKANRQLQIAQISYSKGADTINTLGFIGADDIRAGFAGRFLRLPGETFQLSYETETKNIVFYYD